MFCEAPKNFIPAKRVTDESKYWIGTLSKITTDKDGDATVYINLDNNIKIRNTTGISSSSSMYEQLGELEEGKKIIFNGYFKLHSEGLTTGYFLKTIALTERGALVDPEFDFTFNKIHNVIIGGTASGDTLSKEEMDVEWEKAAEPYKNKDWNRVLQIVKPIAEQGHANAQDLLGLIYSIDKEFHKTMKNH